MIKNSVYGIYFARCMNIFNSLRVTYYHYHKRYWGGQNFYWGHGPLAPIWTAPAQLIQRKKLKIIVYQHIFLNCWLESSYEDQEQNSGIWLPRPKSRKSSPETSRDNTLKACFLARLRMTTCRPPAVPIYSHLNPINTPGLKVCRYTPVLRTGTSEISLRQ